MGPAPVQDQSPEARELSLVGKVELRIALADTDDKIQTALRTYLAPLLLKLASPYLAVRNKVIAICSHINLRIQPQSIQLPVAPLLAQFKEHADSPLLRHFDLLYIKQGIKRLSPSECAALFSVIIKGIAKDSSQSKEHASHLFNFALQFLHHFAIPLRGSQEDSALRSELAIEPSDADYLAQWLGKLILFTPNRARGGLPSPSCPGLTADDYNFLTVQNDPEIWDPTTTRGLQLSRTKILATQLLASGMFTDSERFLPALFASADLTSDVYSVGEGMLKRALPAIDLEHADIIRKLFGLFFGDHASSGCTRVQAPLRLKIFGLLAKSVASTNYTKEIISMVDEGVNQVSANNGPDAMQIDSTPSQGREAAKLRAALFTYINFVARSASTNSLHTIAPVVLERLRDYVEGQGFPQAAPTEDLISRSLAYEIIGLLAKAGPQSAIVEPNLRVVRWLFDALAEDRSNNSIVVSIEEALSSVLTGVSRAKDLGDSSEPLEALLLHQMLESAKTDRDVHNNRRSTRYATIRFANRCLPFSSLPARWVNLLALASTGERHEVGEEGRRGLSPYWYRMLNGLSEDAREVDFPRFHDMVTYLFGSDLNSAACKSIRSVHPGAYVPAILFCRSLLLNEALQFQGTIVKLDSEWDRKVDAIVHNDHDVRQKVKMYITENCQHGSDTAQATRVLYQVLTSTLVAPASSDSAVTNSYADARRGFVDFCGLCPDSITVSMIDYCVVLQDSIYSNQGEVRETAAHAFGILASHPERSGSVSEKIQTMLNDMLRKVAEWRTAVGAVVNKLNGATLALAYYYSRCAARSATHESDSAEYIAKLKTQLLDSTDTSIKAAAMQSFGEMCLFGAIKFPSHVHSDEMRTIIDKIADLARTGNELAALTLGKISMIIPEPGQDETQDSLSLIDERLHKLHEIRQPEAHFAIGEAISYLISGWSSKALATSLDVEPRDSTQILPRVWERSSAFFETLLETTLRDCANTKPSLRKASVMWLLCLVQFCGHAPQIQSRLADCQIAFKRALTDRDELVQETASRGLGLVYEKGDRKVRDDLVRDLVGSFSDTNKRSGQSQLAGQVSADTQLFEPGALPTGQGESVTTYKDIMNLAAEVGDSSLVYRFMSMASSNAIWSSRAAFGRFGLSNVLSDSSVDGYLAQNPKLYPSLYRYRFDPSPTVQRSMNDIWNSLVKDTNKTLDDHFDAILQDLLNNILGREWRTRQACCAAIASLIQGRGMVRYEKHLEQIWNVCFKVLDDIKETVRAAAASLVRTLTGIMTRALESDTASSHTASKMLEQVLPFLLSTSGLESSAQEVQAYALKTLLEIIRKSKSTLLRPFTPELVERLLGLLSTLEPQAVNYLHLNADKYNLTQQKIDDMRLSSIRSSPLMEACERCLDVMDEATMAQFQPRLANAIKTAVGLPSKVGGSRLLVSLSTRHNALFQPHADSFLRLIEKAVLDRNETIASSYAVSAGYVARGASDKQILSLAAFAQKLYFNTPGDRDQNVPRGALTAAEILNALGKHASDKFQSLAVSLLPFVFFGRHDTHETVKQVFDETWSEAVGGPRAVSLYLAEVLTLVDEHIDSAQWAVKHGAARSVAGATTAMVGLANGAGQESLDPAIARDLWPRLDKALGGKTWSGKEVILDAMVSFVKAGSAYFDSNPEVLPMLEKIAVREAKRQNKEYQQSSIPALGKVAAARGINKDLSNTVYEVISPILAELADGDEQSSADRMDVDGGESSKANDALMHACIDALVDATRNVHLQDPPLPRGHIVGALRRTIQAATRVLKAHPGAAGTRAAKEWLELLRPAAESIDSTWSTSITFDEAGLGDLLEKLG